MTITLVSFIILHQMKFFVIYFRFSYQTFLIYFNTFSQDFILTFYYFFINFPLNCL